MPDRKVYVLDIESSLHNKVGDFAANPHSPRNWAVWFGMGHIDIGRGIVAGTKVVKFPTKEEYEIGFPKEYHADRLLVGHNIGFDIHYLCNPNNSKAQDWIDWLNNPEALIWDTQLAEFRLSGQTFISPSLDSCCERRGWPVKPGQLKSYWQQGISTEDIPDVEVDPYLRHDITSTGKLFLDQLQRAQDQGMLALLRHEMRARLTTILMEHNGSCFDSKAALEYRDTTIAPERDRLLSELSRMGHALSGALVPIDAVNPNSNVFLNCLLYGGVFKWREQRDELDADGNPVTFKSGKRKGIIRKRWHDLEASLPGIAPVKSLGSVDEENLLKVLNHPSAHPSLKLFLQSLLDYRDLEKQYSTYLTGYSSLTFEDGMIHGNLNHCIAATGRLSASNPNLQNAGTPDPKQPLKGVVRKFFKSRYENGQILEIDLSQIEVVVQALLSQDGNMIADIINGVDFHSKRAAFAHGQPYEFVLDAAKNESHPYHKVWKQRRKDAKIVSFQKAYGAGVKKIVATTGLSTGVVKAFMEAEDAAYPNVPLSQQAWMDAVAASAKVIDGEVYGELTSPTGGIYRFKQEEYNGHQSFRPTTIKNYPIQGLSADVLKLILSGLRKVILEFNRVAGELHTNNEVLIVNTVHDSVVFDLPEWATVTAVRSVLVRRLLDYFTQYPITVLKDEFGFDFNVPIKAEAEAGATWFDKKEVKPS